MDEPVPLTELYALVPAAEEEDLLDELARERRTAEEAELASGWLSWPSRVRPVWDLWSGEPTDPPEPEPEPEAPEPELPPLPQVLGLLQHRLGAHVLDEDDVAGTDEPG